MGKDYYFLSHNRIDYLFIIILILLYWVLDDYNSMKVFIPLVVGYILGVRKVRTEIKEQESK